MSKRMGEKRRCAPNFNKSRFPLATGRGIGYTFSNRQRKANEMGKRIVTFFVAAMAMGAMAETVNTVEVTKFNQSYPYTGKATVEYTVGGTLPANAVAEITLSADGARATFTQNHVVAGANTFTVDFASSFGGALLLTNASFVVTIAEDLGGVQLWENGPYWAECNVGAARPEESGYYFWWGDTLVQSRGWHGKLDLQQRQFDASVGGLDRLERQSYGGARRGDGASRRSVAHADER